MTSSTVLQVQVGMRENNRTGQSFFVFIKKKTERDLQSVGVQNSLRGKTTERDVIFFWTSDELKFSRRLVGGCVRPGPRFMHTYSSSPSQPVFPFDSIHGAGSSTATNSSKLNWTWLPVVTLRSTCRLVHVALAGPVWAYMSSVSHTSIRSTYQLVSWYMK